MAEVPTPLSAYLLWMQAGIKSKTPGHRLNRWSHDKHWCIWDTIFQRACLVDLNSPSAPVEPTFQNQPSVHWMYYIPESLFELISEPLQYRLLFGRKPGYCVRTTNGYYLDTERPVEPMPSISHPSVLPMVTIFLQWTSNGYVTLSTLYKGTPWLI